jgi:hypothetical protein
MRRVILVGLVAVLLVTLAGSTVSAAKDPFLGVWRGNDPPPDSSNVRMVIHRGPAGYELNYNDDMATACGGDMAMAKGSGTASGNVLNATMDIWCLQPRRFLDTIGTTLTYDPATDTLSEPWVVWHRVSGK